MIGGYFRSCVDEYDLTSHGVCLFGQSNHRFQRCEALPVRVLERHISFT